MTAQKHYSVAVVGATGLVGRTMLRVLEERKFPVGSLRLLASPRSHGSRLRFSDRDVMVEELRAESFQGVELALFSAGAAVSRQFAPEAVLSGALVVDNSSAFRMDPTVPLVVPEVNPETIRNNRGIIANPNCSTIQMVVAIQPLHKRWQIRRIVVSTYQSVTGAGKRAVDQLTSELSASAPVQKKLPHQIAYNVLPQVDVFDADGYSREEHKMIDEARKIMGDDSLRITATCVRVPVIGGHSESVNLEFERAFDLEEVYRVLRAAPGILIQDDFGKGIYPMPIWSHEKDEVFVGRIRRDDSVPNGLNLWIVADNLRKGAATNAVQIAEEWIRQKEIE
jgi:aspartate-semialdehyde dehydrogenase